MSAITIYTKTGLKRYDAPITQDALHVSELMKEHYIQLVFNAPLIEFAVGDYIVHEQQKFTLQELPNPERSGALWKYDIQFDSTESTWKNCVMFYIPEVGAKESEWTLTSQPSEFVSMAVKNINRFSGTNIKTGTILVAETQPITFTNVSVWDALAQIAETFDTEWWFDGEYLHLTKFEFGSGAELMVNKQIQSATGSKGDNKGYATRIYPYGSTRNIIPEVTSSATNSILNNRLKLADLEYIDSKQDLTKEEIVEAVIIFEDIYPRMKDKKITSIRFEEQTINETKQNIYFFKIADLGFDPESLILEKEKLSVKFESGNLNSREFELSWNSTTSEFEILNQNETESIIIPNESLCPAVGDIVVLFNLEMPTSYKTEAQAELLTEAQEYIIESSKDRTVYSCPSNPAFCSNNELDYKIGQKVILKGEEFGIGRESRIQRFEKKLYNKYICTYQVGDNSTYSRLNNVEREAREAKYAITSTALGGSNITIITKYDTRVATDLAVYSALRTEKEIADKALSRINEDTAKEKITFEKGFISDILSLFKQGLEAQGEIKGTDISLSNKLISKLIEVTDKLSATLAEVENINVADTLTAFVAQIRSIISTDISTTDLSSVNASISNLLSLKNAKLTGEISSLNYAEALLGWFIRQDGTAQLKGLRLLEFLEVPELRYNRVTVLAGESWRGPGAGLVESVDSENKIVYLKLEEGDERTVQVDDICKGIYHHNNGFATIFFRVTELVGKTAFKYSLRPNTTIHPEAFMNFIAYGNFTNQERQKSVQETTSYKRYLANVNTWDISVGMIMMQLGDLSGLQVNGVSMSGYSAYLKHIFLTGTIKQIAASGEEINVAIIRGEWISGTQYGYYEQVTHKGSSWLCVNELGTNSEPSESVSDWLEISAKGKDAIICEITSSNGNIFRNGLIGTTLTCVVRKGESEITSSIPQNRFSWLKTSNNTDTDTIFNNQHNGHGNILELTSDDIYGRATFECVVTI